MHRCIRGPRRLVGERRAFLALVAEGVGTSEASRAVRANPRTGRRWLHGRAEATEVGRSPSTFSRENAPNGYLRDNDYRPYAADMKARARRVRPRNRKTAACPRLREAIQRMLDEGLSPEQISGRLRRDHPDDLEHRVSHETIYQALYVQDKGEPRRELSGALRTGRALRRPRNRPHSNRCPGLPWYADSGRSCPASTSTGPAS